MADLDFSGFSRTFQATFGAVTNARRANAEKKLRQQQAERQATLDAINQSKAKIEANSKLFELLGDAAIPLPAKKQTLEGYLTDPNVGLGLDREQDKDLIQETIKTWTSVTDKQAMAMIGALGDISHEPGMVDSLRQLAKTSPFQFRATIAEAIGDKLDEITVSPLDQAKIGSEQALTQQRQTAAIENLSSVELNKARTRDVGNTGFTRELDKMEEARVALDSALDSGDMGKIRRARQRFDALLGKIESETQGGKEKVAAAGTEASAAARVRGKAQGNDDLPLSQRSAGLASYLGGGIGGENSGELARRGINVDLPEAEIKDLTTKRDAAATAMHQMSELIELVGGRPEVLGTTGGLVGFLSSSRAQLQGLLNATGSGKSVSTLANESEGIGVDWLNKRAEEVGKNLNQDIGKVKSRIIQLAYALARINEPGAPRLSKSDLESAFAQLGETGDPERFAAVLADNMERGLDSFGIMERSRTGGSSAQGPLHLAVGATMRKLVGSDMETFNQPGGMGQLIQRKPVLGMALRRLGQEGFRKLLRQILDPTQGEF